MSTTEESPASAAARILNQARWAKVTAAERAEFMAQRRAERTPEQMGAAARSGKPRCPCGAMTATRAKARSHKCEAPEAPPWETKKRTRKTAQ